FENAKPKKSDYRKFKISLDGMPDDFAMMRETLLRRFSTKHVDSQQLTGLQSWPLPDLLVVDGGKGQLGVACQVLLEKSLRIPVIGLAKREEEIFVPGKPDPILLPKSNYALQLLQRLRDEAHRFAITFHKKLRSKQSYRSFLDSVPGIGPKKKKLLMREFGTVQNIKGAPIERLTALVGRKTAHELKRAQGNQHS
ncbi:MAG: excinuclease ABC subunit C, partial [Methylovulum sp.]